MEWNMLLCRGVYNGMKRVATRGSVWVGTSLKSWNVLTCDLFGYFPAISNCKVYWSIMQLDAILENIFLEDHENLILHALSRDVLETKLPFYNLPAQCATDELFPDSFPSCPQSFFPHFCSFSCRSGCACLVSFNSNKHPRMNGSCILTSISHVSLSLTGLNYLCSSFFGKTEMILCFCNRCHQSLWRKPLKVPYSLVSLIICSQIIYLSDSFNSLVRFWGFLQESCTWACIIA